MENKLDRDYQYLLSDVLNNGILKDDRTGTGTISLFGKSIRHDMSKGFPILTTKRVAFKTMVAELKWFLKGQTNIRPLLKEGCHIWTGDAYKLYKRAYDYDLDEYLSVEDFEKKIIEDKMFAHTWGELGPIYGRQWRKWKIVDGSFTRYVDQIGELIKNIKEDPFSRRLVVNAWNVSELHLMTLPPCHYSFQCYVADGKLSLMWNQRSADLFLGVPFNISSYGLLLSLLCEETGYEPGELIGNFGDIHLYKNHYDQATKQINRSHYKLPTLEIKDSDILNGEFDYELKGYKSHNTIKAKLNN